MYKGTVSHFKPLKVKIIKIKVVIWSRITRPTLTFAFETTFTFSLYFASIKGGHLYLCLKTNLIYCFRHVKGNPANTCDFIVDLEVPHEDATSLEPTYSLDTTHWQEEFSVPFLDAKRSPNKILRAFYVPFLRYMATKTDLIRKLEKKNSLFAPTQTERI